MPYRSAEGPTRIDGRVVLTAILTASLLISGAGAQVPDGSTRVVDVWGNATRATLLGLEDRERGEPVLLLFSGAGAPSDFWGDWLSEISSLAPVVTYDRPGIGGSSFDGIEPTPQHVIEHAHALLGVLDVPPPYILVGWSWGGPLIRYYAGQYPDDVVGMVYLDPTDMTATSAEAAGASSEAQLREIHAELDSVMATRRLPPGREAERRVITRFNRSSLSARALPDDPSVPTSVIIATQVPSIPDTAPSYVTQDWYETMFARRVRQFGEWARGRPATTLIVASASGHAVHRDAPDLATEAVRQVVAAVSR